MMTTTYIFVLHILKMSRLPYLLVGIPEQLMYVTDVVSCL